MQNGSERSCKYLLRDIRGVSIIGNIQVASVREQCEILRNNNELLKEDSSLQSRYEGTAVIKKQNFLKSREQNQNSRTSRG